MDNIRDIIIANYTELTDSDKHIAKILLNNSKTAHTNTIDELACMCAVSKSTIIRFTKKLGLDGYSELRVLMKMNNRLSDEVDQNFINRVADNDIQIINHYREYDFEPIIKMLDSSPTIYAFGTGMFQRSVVKELSRLFMHIDRWVRITEGTGELEIAIKHMKENDTLIIVSSEGENQYLNEIYDLLKLKGVHILSFTNTSSNSLAYASNYNISTELNRETFYDKFYYDNIVTMYIPLKMLFANYINFLVDKFENADEIIL
jgi:RpiR family glv operon transcriptional regulator